MSRTIAFMTLMLVGLSANLPANLSANDVEVVYLNGMVLIEGDSSDNAIEISRVYNSIHIVRGLNGTTVGGASSQMIYIADDLLVEMFDGDDFIDIRSLHVRGNANAQVVIGLGEGDDTLIMENASVRFNILISDPPGSDGNDIALLRSITCNDLDILTELGTDQISVVSSTVNENLEIRASGAATVGVTHSDIDGGLFINTGRLGADTINVIANDFVWTSIHTSDRNDNLIIVGNHSHYVWGSISLNNGNDNLTFEHNQMGDWYTWQGGALLVDGGPGTDRGMIRRVMIWDPIVTESWEGSFK
ncbi:hypothetical protein [Stieleria varia]|uniref:Right handed beta helix domain-containing protein n=1 Tax=Stieleria varia TaxID=2528005 RepID=A0A5C6AP69_9BACT|nr:hypothetical protein [Stieleria varia]TWU00906.1 hypothetical protein Pla52n_42750 [Stieleria varia]